MLDEPWTVERFLAWEDRQEGRHEFDGVRIIPMTGGNRNHQRIVFNLLKFLDDFLDADKFDVVQEMRVNIGGKKIRYPDISVCAGIIPGRLKTLRDAVVTFEVISDETADTDRDEKRRDYARLPGIRTYVLLEQTSMTATVLQRDADGWTETQLTSGSIALPEIGVELPLDAVYRRVRF